MPYKYPKSKDWHVPKQKYKIINWSEYNQALKNRGSIDFWLTDDAVEQWHEVDQDNIGCGAPQKYTDFAIITCHEIRQVYKQPLRQTEGFINSIFRMMKLDIKCPSYSVLSKRLSLLGIESPRYAKNAVPEEGISTIAVDSTGLKRFGRDEWHQEKHKVSAKRSWRKLHIAVDQDHYIQGTILTNRFDSDEGTLDDLIDQFDVNADHVSLDGAYDSFNVYEQLSDKFPGAEIVIPPDKNAVINDGNHVIRNHNLEQIIEHGRMHWQKLTQYGRRNYSELAIQRYKRILGNRLHSRELSRQKQEAMICSSVLNKMTSLGMPISYRYA
jgi:transposase